MPDLPHFNTSDFVILTPLKASLLKDPDLPPDKFYLLSVLEDKGKNFDFEILIGGPCALVEAIAISACKKGQRIWFPHEPLRDTNP